jgi:hypothetical protein
MKGLKHIFRKQCLKKQGKGRPTENTLLGNLQPRKELNWPAATQAGRLKVQKCQLL